MKISEIVKLLDAEIVCGNEYLENTIEKGFASDLMSDVLTLQTENILLITGLANLQTIRTAEMADITSIVIARNKKITPEILSLARENNMLIIECPYSMFKICGILYASGLKPVY